VTHTSCINSILFFIDQSLHEFSLPVFYGRQIITSELLTIDEYRQDAAKEPLFRLALGRKLRSPEICMDALRHIVGSYGLTRLPDRFCAELSMDDSDFRVAVHEKREKLDAITIALRTRLERLAVVPMPRS